MPCKSSLSYLNKKRDAAFFEDLYFSLLEKLEPLLPTRRLYAPKIKPKVFLMDSSVITLSLSLFDWAKYRTTKRALKLHAVLDYDSSYLIWTARKS